jgi:hypothetical protein
VKRDEIVAGEVYVTEHGKVVRIKEDDTRPNPITGQPELDPGTENGWGVVDGEWVESPIMQKRFMGRGKGYQEYQANLNVRCWNLGTVDQSNGRVTLAATYTKDVVVPRVITHRLADHDEVWKTLRASEQQILRRTKAVHAALKKAGLGKAKYDADSDDVTVPLDALLSALKIEVKA